MCLSERSHQRPCPGASLSLGGRGQASADGERDVAPPPPPRSQRSRGPADAFLLCPLDAQAPPGPRVALGKVLSGRSVSLTARFRLSLLVPVWINCIFLGPGPLSKIYKYIGTRLFTVLFYYVFNVYSFCCKSSNSLSLSLSNIRSLFHTLHAVNSQRVGSSSLSVARLWAQQRRRFGCAWLLPPSLRKRCSFAGLRKPPRLLER